MPITEYKTTNKCVCRLPDRLIKQPNLLGYGPKFRHPVQPWLQLIIDCLLWIFDNLSSHRLRHVRHEALQRLSQPHPLQHLLTNLFNIEDNAKILKFNGKWSDDYIFSRLWAEIAPKRKGYWKSLKGDQYNEVVKDKASAMLLSALGDCALHVCPLQIGSRLKFLRCLITVLHPVERPIGYQYSPPFTLAL